MFWGLIMEPQKRYSQVIKKAFHISMAALDISNSDGQPSQVMCGYEGRNYLLCTLQKSGLLQCPLDLHFEEGTTVSFATNGKSHVHLTGYLTKDLDEMEMGDESDEEAQEFEVKPQKKSTTAVSTEDQPPNKKMKKAKDQPDDESDESDDSDVDFDKLMNMSDEELSEEESEGLEEEEEEDSDEAEEEDEDDEDAEEDQDEEEEEVKVEPVMNGLGKKSKKTKKENQETPKKDNQQKEKKMKQTPGPKSKTQENGDVETSKKKGKEEKKSNQVSSPKKKTLSGGVIVEDLKEGQGDGAGNGKFVHVYYEGRLKSNNKVFDKTHNGPGFGFRLGKGEVIKGWDIGVSGMKVGGKRRITCPPHVAYGAKGSPPVIPPNSTLIFEVELRKIK